MIFAYFGPETVLPLASVLATVLGVVMMCGRMSLRVILYPLRWLGRGRRSGSAGATMRGPTTWRRGSAHGTREAQPAETREEA